MLRRSSDRRAVGIDRRWRHARACAVAVAAGVGLVTAGCGSDSPGAAQTATDGVRGSFVGRVLSSDAFVAVVTDGRRATAYVCDGKPGDRGAVIGERFDGTVTGDRLNVVSQSGARLEATLGTRGVDGSIRLARDAEQLEFQAVPASGRAGYYRSEAGDAQGGDAAWIVLASGEQRGVRTRSDRSAPGTVSERSRTREPAPPLDRQANRLVVPGEL
jgi:hypothetical protein